MNSTIHTPRAVVLDTTEDDGVVRLHRLVRHLVADGDRRADGHHARRTLEEMAPGYTRPSPLFFHQPPRAADDACVLCGFWTCRCGGSVTAASIGASVMAVAR